MDVVDGLIESVVDGDGVETTYTYDALRRLESETNGDGETTTYAYDDAGRVILITSELGAEQAYTYDDAGRVLTSTAPDGGITTNTYDEAGRLLTVEDPEGGVTTYDYDTDGLLLSVTDPNLEVTSYTYDDAGRLETETRPGDEVTTYTYTTLSRVATVTDPRDRVTTYTYDADGRTNSVTNDNGEVTGYSYDQAGRVVSTTDAADRATTTTYDEFGRTDTVTTPAGGVTTYSYDALNRVASVTDARGGESSTTYTDGGRTDTSTDAAGVVTSYTYDPAGRTETMTVGGAVTTYSYDDDGRIETVMSDEGDVTSYTYDDAGHVLTVTDPAGVVTTDTWDLNGRKLTEQLEDQGVVTYTYDDAGNMLTATDALDETTTWEYDGNNRPIARTNALDKIDTWEYWPGGELKSSTDPLDDPAGPRTTSYDYEGAGRVATVTDPTGRVTLNTYNPDGTLAEVQFSQPEGPDPILDTYAYEPETGRLSVATDPNGSTSYTYNPAGDITSMTRFNAARDYTTRHYFDVSNVDTTSATNGSGGTSITIDQPSEATPGDLLVAAVGVPIPTHVGARADDFTASNDDPWNSIWSTATGGAATFDVQDDQGHIEIPALTEDAEAVLLTSDATQSDAHADFEVDALPAGDISFWLAGSGQVSDTNPGHLTDGYRLRADLDDDVVSIESITNDDSPVELASVPFSFSADTSYRVHLDTTSGVIVANIWPTGDPEPDTWMLAGRSDAFLTGTFALSAHVEDDSALNVLIDNVAAYPASWDLTDLASDAFSINDSDWNSTYWTTSLSGSGDFSVADGLGNMSIAASSQAARALASPGLELNDGLTYIEFTPDSAPAADVSLWLRGSTTWSSTAPDRLTDGYRLRLDLDDDTIAIEKIVSDDTPVLLSSASYDFTAEGFVFASFSALGTTLVGNVNGTYVFASDGDLSSGDPAVSAGVTDSSALNLSFDQAGWTQRTRQVDTGPGQWQDDVTITPPAGWQSQTEAFSAGPVKLETYTHVAANTDPSDWTFDLSATSKASAAVTAYRGVDPITPVAYSSSTTAGSEDPQNIVSVAPTVGKQAVVAIAATDIDTSYTPPDAFTERADIATSASNAVTVTVADRNPTGANVTIGGAFTPADTSSSAGVSILLNPDYQHNFHEISAVNSTTATNGSGGNDVTIDQPAAVTQGDLLLAAISVPATWVPTPDEDLPTDNFTGTNNDDWNTKWTTSSTGSADIDLLDNQGRIALPALTDNGRAVLTPGASDTVELKSTVTVDSLPSGEISLWLSGSGEWSTTYPDRLTSGYRLRLDLDDDIADLEAIVDDTAPITLGTSSFDVDADTTYSVRVSTVQPSFGIAAKIWPAADPEPDTWNVVGVRNEFLSGTAAISVHVDDGSALEALFDNFSAFAGYYQFHDGTYDFFDTPAADWSSTYWTTSLVGGSGDFSVADGTGLVGIDSGTDAAQALVDPGLDLTDGTSFAGFTPSATPNGDVSVWIRGSTTWSSGHPERLTDGYRVRADLDDDTISIEKIVSDGTPSVLATASYDFQADHEVDMGINVHGALLDAYVAGPEGNAEILASDDTITAGDPAISVGVYDSTALAVAVDYAGWEQNGPTLFDATGYWQNTTISPPDGWTNIAETTDSPVQLDVFTTRATGDDPSDWTFDLADSSKAAGQITAYHGVSLDEPVASTNTAIAASADPQMITPTTADTTNQAIVAVRATGIDTSYTPPDDFTERADIASSATNAVTLTLADLTPAPVNTATTGTFTPADLADSAGVTILLNAERIADTTFTLQGESEATTSFDYDEAGRRTYLQFPDGTEINYSYDPTTGLLDTIQDANNPSNTITYGFDGDRRITSEETPNSLREWTWDNGQLVAYSQDLPGTGDDIDTTLTYDTSGRVETDTTNTVTTTYTYDNAGQLLSADDGTTTRTWTYDELGRWETSSGPEGSFTYTYDDASQLQTADCTSGACSDTTYTFDRAGRRLSSSRTDGSSTAYHYDAQGKLADTTLVDGEGSQNDVARALSADGRLEAISKFDGESTEQQQFFWDPGWVLRATSPDGGSTYVNQVTPSTSGIFETRPTSWTGDIDQVGGPFGESLSTTGTGYRGELQTSDGLTHLRNREYDPTTGQFLSVDPIGGIPGGTTVSGHYAYANNEPLQSSDPSGLSPTTDASVALNGGGGSHGSCAGSCYTDPNQVMSSQLDALLPQWASDIKVLRMDATEMSNFDDGQISGAIQDDWVWSNKRFAFRAEQERSWVYSQPDVGGGEGPENARQHLYIAARLTVEFGEKDARTILNVHEGIRLENGNYNEYAGWNDARKMDLINNEVGIEIGLEVLDRYGPPRSVCAYGGNCVTVGGFYEDAAVQFMRERATAELNGGKAVWLHRCAASCEQYSSGGRL
jgi:RHS repeat-associated protein